MEDHIIIQTLKKWEGKMPDDVQLAHALDMAKSLPKLKRQLESLQEQGLVMKTQRGKWAIPSMAGFCIGKIQRTRKGFGFLLPFDPDEEDVFIPAHHLKGAMNDDVVIISLVKRVHRGRMKTEGNVYKILQRAKSTIVGTLETIPSGGFVVSDDPKFDQDIFIPRKRLNNAQNGEKVVAKIIEYPSDKRSPVGEITEVLGSASDIGIDILSIIRDKGLRDTFAPGILQQAEQLSQQDPNDHIAGRADLRDVLTFTIDGADSKDFDDAVSIEKLPKKAYRLGVHIADVSHYVCKGTALDDEALERATSVYLVDRVLPMLPESLSNGICSLNEGVDRLTMSCIMDIDPQGKVFAYKITPSIIRSKARLTYTQVNQLLDGDKKTVPSIPQLAQALTQMNTLAASLRGMWRRRGTIELDIDEPHIQLNDEGVPVSIQARERGDSHRMIEEFMLCANETVAKYVYDKKLPFMYRVHEQPDPEKMTEFGRFANNLGYQLMGSPETIEPKKLQELLDAAKGHKDEDVLHRIMLRTLQKARYAPENHGHYGLASEFYCHFTSPIRRYPDLVVHRVLKAIIYDDVKYIRKLGKNVSKLAEHCSSREREAMEAERKVDDLKMTEYMTHHIGEIFDGIISGVKEFGFFVELDNTIEGLVHITDLQDDYYVFHEHGYMLSGERTGREFRLGDAVRVQCTKADIASCNIDFSLAEE